MHVRVRVFLPHIRQSHVCERKMSLPPQDETVDGIINEDSRDSCIVLNANKTDNSSSKLLGSLGGLNKKLVGEVEITTGQIILNKASFNVSFIANLNSSFAIDISNTASDKASMIATILLSTLNNVMSARNDSIYANSGTRADNVISAAVVLVKIT